MDFYEFDAGVRAEGYALLCGVDEAGRGPLAGPVYAAAVILSPDTVLDRVNDSKKLSPKRRDRLFDEIIEKAAAYGVASASVEEIAELNILQASLLAMARAAEQLKMTPSLILVDGLQIPKQFLRRGIPARAVTHGDGLSASIAAASILAKVSRDRYMLELDQKYPQYGFRDHKGYGTAAHYAALAEYGPSPIHRMGFIHMK